MLLLLFKKKYICARALLLQIQNLWYGVILKSEVGFNVDVVEVLLVIIQRNDIIHTCISRRGKEIQRKSWNSAPLGVGRVYPWLF